MAKPGVRYHHRQKVFPGQSVGNETRVCLRKKSILAAEVLVRIDFLKSQQKQALEGPPAALPRGSCQTECGLRRQLSKGHIWMASHTGGLRGEDVLGLIFGDMAKLRVRYHHRQKVVPGESLGNRF